MVNAFGGTETKAEEAREAASEPKNDTMAKRHAKKGDLIHSGDMVMSRKLKEGRKAMGKR